MRGRTEEKAHIPARYIALGLIFSVLCIAFVVMLAVYQIRGSSLPFEEDGTIRTYTVPGLRGEIYDCNGNLLVGNSTSYDLIYEYGAMPDTRKEVNQSLLSVMDAVLHTGNGDKLTQRYSVLKGTYPKMEFVSELKDKESSEYFYYKRFLKRREWDSEEVDAKDLVNYFTDRYQLYESLYSKEQITALIQLYYEMERVDFGSYSSYTIAENVNMKLITFLEESNIAGVNFQIRSERSYEYAGVASHILGRLGNITAEMAEYYTELGYPLDAKVGISGCEQVFEEWLRGQNGKMVIRYDDDGNMVEKYYDPEPIRGNDVYLTIDIDLQIAAEEGLAKSVEGIETANAGAITVMDPNTGKVLATASYPTYDLTQFESKEYVDWLNRNGNNPWLNRALQGVYAPGSTYKIGAALAALEEGKIDSSTCFSCDGVFHKYDKPECLHSHGSTDVIGAIRDSCNIFFYHLGDIMGVDAITNYTARLGLGQNTGLELFNQEGSIATQNSNPGDTVRSAIGQSDHGYTPLQLSVYMSTIVNGGTRYSATLLDSVRKYYTKELVTQAEMEILDQVEFSDITYAILLEGMAKVVSENTQVSGYFKGVPVAVGGKTGTAEVTGKIDNALFCGFAPLENPEIVVSCVIEEGRYGYRAAEAAGKVMEKYFEKYSSEVGTD